MKRIAAPFDEQDQLIFLGEDFDSFQGCLFNLTENDYDALSDLDFWEEVNRATNSMIADYESEVIAGEEDLRKTLQLIESKCQQSDLEILVKLKEIFNYALTHNQEVYFLF